MRKKIILFLWGALVLLACPQCHQDVDIALPTTASKLAVAGFICPQDTILTVYVGESKPTFSNTQQRTITDATVEIWYENDKVTLSHTQNGYYRARPTFAIQAGKTYQLRVSTPDGRAIKGQCTIPSQRNTSLSVHLEDNNAESWQARIAWDDFANETNYYRVLAYPMSYVNPTTSRYWTRSVLDWADNDQNRQGARLTTNKLIDNLSLSPYPDRSFHLLFMLLTTDEHYFKYMESIRASSQNNYNPFAEPTFVHTNIEGGLGTFAGYQRFDYEVVRY